MNFHDTRETRDPEARERELLARLPAQRATGRVHSGASPRWRQAVIRRPESRR